MEYMINRKYQYFFTECLEMLNFNCYGDFNDENSPHCKKSNDNYYFEDDYIMVNSYYWGENKKEITLPNFIYKKENLIIEWYKYPFRSSTSNIKITKKILIAMFEDLFTCYGLDAKKVVRIYNSTKNM